MSYGGGRLYLGDNPHGERVELSAGERSTHLHVIGAAGSGKSRFLEHLIRQDIIEGRGVCVIDPHGTLYRRLMGWLSMQPYPSEKVRVMQPGREGWTFGFNPLAFDGDDPDQLDFKLRALVEATAQVWGSENTKRTPLLRMNLRILYGALVDLGLPISNARYLLQAKDTDGTRGKLIDDLTDPSLKHEWEQLGSYRTSEFQERFASTKNRLFELVGSPVLERIVSHGVSLDTRRAMDEGEVILVDLSPQGDRFHRENATALGALLVNDFLLRARGRTGEPKPFHLYIDECHRYITEDIVDILFEARKFGLHLTLAHQDLSQLRNLEGEIYGAIMSGAQTKVLFQIGEIEDAETIAKDRMFNQVREDRVRRGILNPIVVGHEIIKLFNESESQSTNESETEGSSEGMTDVETIGGSDSENNTLSTPVEDADRAVEAVGEGRVTTKNRATGHNWTTTKQKTKGTGSTTGFGSSQALKPKLEERETTPMSFADQIYSIAIGFKTLKKRHAILSRKPGDEGRSIEAIRVPDVEEISFDLIEPDFEQFETEALERTEFARQGVEEADWELLNPAPPPEEPPGW